MGSIFDYDAELLRAQQIAQELKGELEEMVLGTKRDARYSTHLGELPESEVIAVIPGGEHFSYHITSPYTWTACMKEVDGEKTYECGICDLIEPERLRDLFGQRFSDIDTKALTRVYFNRYPPKDAD